MKRKDVIMFIERLTKETNGWTGWMSKKNCNVGLIRKLLQSVLEYWGGGSGEEGSPTGRVSLVV